MITAIFCVTLVGCQVPQKVVEDVKVLKADEQALFEFNQEFLKKAKSSNNEELQKKLKIIMICNMAHERSSRGLELLMEYLGSTEVITSGQLNMTEEMISKIANKVAEKMGDNDGESK